MENPANNDYHISFFKPTTKRALLNRNMVIWLASIWFVAVFGFHFLLRIIEEPTPEPSYLQFQQVWEPVSNNAAETAELQTFGQAVLSVLGKISIAPEDQEVLNNALSWSVLKLAPESEQAALLDQIDQFQSAKEASTNISDSAYVSAKINLMKDAAPLLGLALNDVRVNTLPHSLHTGGIGSLSDETLESLPAVMGKYLIHYQSMLTDFKFFGFPFHYFYTAVFLLILFVFLCWMYCVKTDQRNAKLGIVD